MVPKTQGEIMPKKDQIQQVPQQQDKEVIGYAVDILKVENSIMHALLSSQHHEDDLKSKYFYKSYDLLSKKLGLEVKEALRLKYHEDDVEIVYTSPTKGQMFRLSRDEYGALWNETFNDQDKLIRFSDYAIAQYSPFRVVSELEKFMLKEGPRTWVGLIKDLSPFPARKYYDQADQIIDESTPYNTRMAYQGDVAYWTAWRRAKGQSLDKPFDVDEACQFIVEHTEGLYPDVDKRLVDVGYKKNLGPHKLATVKRRIAAISVFCDAQEWPNPTRDRKVNQLLKCLTKKYGGSKPAGRAITLDILNLMLDTCNKSRMNDIRDRALLLFGWSSGGRRRSEIAEARMEDLQDSPDSSYVYTMPKSKTDQQKSGHVLPVNGRAAAALKAWLDETGITTGPIFRSIKKGDHVQDNPLSGTDINRIVKKRLKMVGLNSSLYSAHSLRSGFVTQAGRSNKPIGDVMALTTHKSHTTFMKYYQPGNVRHNSAANLADEGI